MGSATYVPGSRLRVLTAKAPDIASASTIAIGDGNRADVTGTTTVNFLSTAGWTAGSMVVLRFTGVLSLKHNTAAPPAATAAFDLSGSADLATVNGTRIALVYNGAKWEQIAPAVVP